mmetsp:Transcript_53834/g.127095  ORF Transcript_53834/g.127095 Transcript_53834/m.127095 type:complete len:221 (-) Transcript_53834:25-687(-)
MAGEKYGDVWRAKPFPAPFLPSSTSGSRQTFTQDQGCLNLAFAVMSCNTQQVRHLLEQGLDPDRCTLRMLPGSPAGGHFETRATQPSGRVIFPVFSFDRVNNFSPLHLLVVGDGVVEHHEQTKSPRCLECAQLLVRVQSLEKRTVDGKTPLHFAAETCRRHLATALVENGASPTATDNKGRTPADLVPKGCQALYELLTYADVLIPKVKKEPSVAKSQTD